MSLAETTNWPEAAVFITLALCVTAVVIAFMKYSGRR